MERVAIVGCGGAGKSFVALELGRRSGILVVHLDAFYWDAEWRARPAGEWDTMVRRLLERDAWIIDGNYGGTMDLRLAAADTVIFLDVPTHVCLRRVLLRRAKAFLGHPRAEIAGRERLTLAFLGWILGYRRSRRPALLKRLASLDPGTRVVILRSKAAVRDFLKSTTAPQL